MNNVTRNDIMQSLIDLKYEETKVDNALAQNALYESNDIGIRFIFRLRHFYFV